MVYTIRIDVPDLSDVREDPLELFSVIVPACSVAVPIEPRGSVPQLLDAAKSEAVAVQAFELAAAIRDVRDRFCGGE